MKIKNQNYYGLPENAALLTFDDGYVDHYTNVFPILKNRGIQGSFFVSAKPLAENKVLDVNKIHYLLATVDSSVLVDNIFLILNRYRYQGELIESNEELYNKFTGKSRFDTQEVIFIKSLLQYGLDAGLRDLVIQELFHKYIDVSEELLSKEWYLNWEQICCMKSAGMFFGLHGYEHFWLSEVSNGIMEKDIECALDYFDGIIDRSCWVMNYPYGSYNNEVISFIKAQNCKLGLTTEVRVADISNDDLFELPRLDTNDFPPKSKNYKKF
ncbi:polysaccharide deacetylase family protein [Acetobacterium wieringae]|uniref:polysaccharide deacetylase family protein n=1 Tax=Acetobacterium wieringae TaxID=52694 RepID=UPI002B20EC63|nr:polysaccharide deacetylase family protein [Acetobacterium wieringae]MEA4804374.1 polysaccharide deacetylase family protein [Acetobacterium wieringae]